MLPIKDTITPAAQAPSAPRHTSNCATSDLTHDDIMASLLAENAHLKREVALHQSMQVIVDRNANRDAHFAQVRRDAALACGEALL